MKKLKLLASTILVFLNFSMFQLQLSQAADDEMQTRMIDDGNKTVRGEEESRPVEMTLTIPPVSQGHEEIYRRFLNGVLIYRPNTNSDVGMVTLPIRELGNPLEGTFDLSHCRDTGRYLSILTGYRKGKKPENANKVEVWIAPRFLIEGELDTTAAHFKLIMERCWEQKAEVGLFWTWGEWNSLSNYDYLTTQSIDEISSGNLYEKWGLEDSGRRRLAGLWGTKQMVRFMLRF